MSAWDGTPQQLMIAIASLLADNDNTAAQAVFFEAVEAANAYRRLPTPPTSRGLVDEVAMLSTSLEMTKQQLERVEARLKAVTAEIDSWAEAAEQSVGDPNSPTIGAMVYTLRNALRGSE